MFGQGRFLNSVASKYEDSLVVVFDIDRTQHDMLIPWLIIAGFILAIASLLMLLRWSRRYDRRRALEREVTGAKPLISQRAGVVITLVFIAAGYITWYFLR